MKSILIAVVVPAAAIAAIAGFASADIEGSKHDFTNQEWSGGDACSACHAPHPDELPDAAPVWDPDADLSRRFGLVLGDTRAPGNGTLVCIRCHDGTLAPETITGVEGDRYPNKHHPGLSQAGHGTTDHPVGVEYPQFDEGFHPAPTVLAGGKVWLPDGKVECMSCHDPHDQSGEGKMLVRSNARSALCLTCHKK